jgi:hypothetical protein
MVAKSSAALEQPVALANEVREFSRPLRRR